MNVIQDKPAVSTLKKNMELNVISYLVIADTEAVFIPAVRVEPE